MNSLFFLSLCLFIYIFIFVELPLPKWIGGLICWSDCQRVFWQLYETLTCFSFHLMFQSESFKEYPHNEIEFLYENSALKHVFMFTVHLNFPFNLRSPPPPSFLCIFCFIYEFWDKFLNNQYLCFQVEIQMASPHFSGFTF